MKVEADRTVLRPFCPTRRNAPFVTTDSVGVPPDSRAARPCPGPPLGGGRPAILVVDDHLAIAAECRPDIALVDLFLAGKGSVGLAAMRALAYRGVTVLAFTASDDP